MRRKALVLAVLFMSSATTMRVHAAPDCAEILKYRGEVVRPAETRYITQNASLADPETKICADVDDQPIKATSVNMLGHLPMFT